MFAEALFLSRKRYYDFRSAFGCLWVFRRLPLIAANIRGALHVQPPQFTYRRKRKDQRSFQSHATFLALLNEDTKKKERERRQGKDLMSVQEVGRSNLSGFRPTGRNSIPTHVSDSFVQRRCGSLITYVMFAQRGACRLAFGD